MLYGALIGACVGLVFAVVYSFVAKGKPCPRCREALPVPLFAPPSQCAKCGCKLAWTRGEPREKGRDD